MDRWIGRVALVTGASSGIGKVLAKKLAEHGMIVFGVARSVEKIEQFDSSTGGKVMPMKCDVRKEDDIKAVFQAINTKYGGVDVCVNNAGLAHDAPLLTGATEDWRDMTEVNVIAPAVITREFMTSMKNKGIDDGHIFFLNSMSGHRIIPASNTHFYSVTKFALTALVEGTRQELREMKSNCRVTGVSPGMVRTEFRGRLLKAQDMEAAIKDYDNLLDGDVLESEDIVDTIIFALSAPPRMEINDVYIRPTTQKF
jgi:NADP-dependent 3-hydroxy acid dehydrogenase YdfG